METVPAEEFLRWAVGAGIDFDPRYPDSRCLSLVPPRDHARFWALPGDPARWPHFVASLLGGLDKWATGLLWPRSGGWPHSSRSQSYNERVLDVVLRGAGVPDGRAGAIRFDRDEEGPLLAVVFAHLAFGWCVEDDLFFVPDHGRQLLQTDHHDVIHAECASAARARKLVRHMADAGYELPTEPPDWTFKRPAWMGSGRVSPGSPTDRRRD
jgi:hypothetical protein